MGLGRTGCLYVWVVFHWVIVYLGMVSWDYGILGHRIVARAYDINDEMRASARHGVVFYLGIRSSGIGGRWHDSCDQSVPRGCDTYHWLLQRWGVTLSGLCRSYFRFGKRLAQLKPGVLIVRDTRRLPSITNG